MGKEREGRGRGKGEREEEGLRDRRGGGKMSMELGNMVSSHPSPFSVLPSGINVMKLSDA